MKTDENRRGLNLMKTAGPEMHESWRKPPGPKIDESCRARKVWNLMRTAGPYKIYENWWKPLGPKIDENCRARKVWNLMKTAGT